jgi:hypothetical protein
MGLCASLSYLVEAAEQASRGTDDFLLAYRISEQTELVIVDDDPRAQNFGSTLVLLFGTPAAAATVTAIATGLPGALGLPSPSRKVDYE